MKLWRWVLKLIWNIKGLGVWVKQAEPRKGFLYRGYEKLIEFKTYVQIVIFKWVIRIVSLVAMVLLLAMVFMLETSLRMAIATLMWHGVVVALLVYFYYTGLKPTAIKKTKQWPTDRFISTRDLKVVGQRGKFWDPELSEYWGISNFFAMWWISVGLPVFLCQALVMESFFFMKLVVVFLAIGWVVYIASFLYVNRIDYFLRYYSDANMMVAQNIAPYAMSSGFSLMFVGLSVSMPKPIPPILNWDDTDNNHRDKAFGHPPGINEDKFPLERKMPSKVCSVCGMSDEMFARQLEASRRAKLVSQPVLPWYKRASAPALFLDTNMDADIVEACFNAVEAGSVNFRGSQGLGPNTEQPLVFNNRSKLIAELSKKMLSDDILMLLNTNLQAYRLQPSELQPSIIMYFETSRLLREVGEGTPSWDNLYKQHYNHLVGLYLLSAVSGEEEWGWHAERAKVGIVVVTIRQ